MNRSAFECRQQAKKISEQLIDTGWTNSDFEVLRQLMVIFPLIEQKYKNDADQIRRRLQLQIAIWIGDLNGIRKNKKLDFSKKILPIIGTIHNYQDYQNYRYLLHTVVADFKAML